MNKLLLSLLTVIACNTYSTSVHAVAPSVSLKKDIFERLAFPVVKLAIGSSLICAILTSIQEIGRDWGFNELEIKQLQDKWMIRLSLVNEHQGNLMSAKEIKFWGAVEGIAARFKVYKREIFASLGTIGLTFLALKFLQSGASDIDAFVNYWLTTPAPVIILPATPVIPTV